MRIFKQSIMEGEMMPPFFYGHSYYDFGRSVDVYLPMPFNFIYRWIRNLNIKWCRFRGKRSSVDIEFHKKMQELWKTYEGYYINSKMLDRIVEVWDDKNTSDPFDWLPRLYASVELAKMNHKNKEGI